MMKKFLEWLFDGNTNEEKFQGVYAEEIKAKERPYFAEGKVAIAEAKDAINRYRKEAGEARDAHVTDKAKYRIVHRPAGHFAIEVLRVLRADHYESIVPCIGGYVRWADITDAKSRTPIEEYHSVEDFGHPSYSRYGGVLYGEKKFNTFDEAESYLFRLANPEAGTTEYDFPPLKKRAKASAKK